MNNSLESASTPIDEVFTEVSQKADVPIDFLWKIVSDFATIARGSALKVRSIEGEEIESRCAVQMEWRAIVTEQMLSCDADNRPASLCNIAAQPMPPASVSLHYPHRWGICAAQSSVLGGQILGFKRHRPGRNGTAAA